jgi:hypothetical protein
MTPKIAIVGSRGFKRLDLIRSALENMMPCEVVSGGAPGVDREAERLAQELHCPTRIFPADWKGQGRDAGKIRNKEIVDYCDALLIFWDGDSPGTQHVLALAMIEQKPLILTLLNPDGQVSCAKRNWP